MAAPRRLGELAAHLQPAAAAGAPFPQLSGTELPPWRGGLPGGLRLKATAGVGTNTRENRREDDGKPDDMQPGHGRKIWTIELVDEAEAGGEVVSWCCFVEQDIRIGGASVVAANVTGVGTWQHRRRRGYSSIVIEAALLWMARQGHAITLLTGVPNYYHQFGYVSIPVSCTLNVLSSTLAERLPGVVSPSITIEPSSEGDIDAITELYAAENATRSCTVDRPREMIAEQMASFLSPEQPLEGARFVTTTDEESARVGRLLGISDDGLIASVSFFGEDPDGPADDASGEDDSEETHDSEMPQYTAEVHVGSLTRWSWGSDWASVKEGGQMIGYFCCECCRRFRVP